MFLSDYLEKYGISSAQFSIRASVSNSLIRKILTTSKDIALSVAIRIVRATDYEVGYEELLPKGVLEEKTNYIKAGGRVYRRETGLNKDTVERKPDKKNNKKTTEKKKKK